MLAATGRSVDRKGTNLDGSSAMLSFDGTHRAEAELPLAKRRAAPR